VLADDALRIAGLQRGFAHRAKFRHKHGDERVPQHVVREVELLREFRAALLKIAHHERKPIERVGAQRAHISFWKGRQEPREERADSSDRYGGKSLAGC
jgi:hypothetical protein